MSDLFISHSSSDNVTAKEIERQLARHGHRSVFLDFGPAVGIVAGRNWERTLYVKLGTCRAVIAVCSDQYLDSKWCFAEIALARMENKHIFTLLIDPLTTTTRIPSILSEQQCTDLRTAPDEGYYLELKLSKRISRMVGVRIWRDTSFEGNRLFDQTIKAKITQSAIFVALPSLPSTKLVV
jgi:TIR domain